LKIARKKEEKDNGNREEEKDGISQKQLQCKLRTCHDALNGTREFLDCSLLHTNFERFDTV
jgi:hypothetical protein